MTRKRMRTNLASERNNASKEPNLASKLDDLSFEVLDMILEHVVPDPRDLRLFLQPKSTAGIYTLSILQVSRSLRRQCFDIINRRCIWIRLKFRDTSMHSLCSIWLEPNSAVPINFQYLIPENAPMLSLEMEPFVPACGKEGLLSAHPTAVFPFNFATLIQFFELLNIELSHKHQRLLLIRYENLSDHSQREVVDLIVPALSQLRGFEHVKFDTPITSLDFHPWAHGSPLMPEDLISAFDEAGHILSRTRDLKNQGFYDEANVFVLCSLPLLLGANQILPRPSDWHYGEINPWSASPRIPSWIVRAGQCARGNQLRQLRFEIQEKAILAYISLIEKYGIDWCAGYGWFEYADEDLGLGVENNRFWFGLGSEGQVRFYHACASLYHSIAELTASAEVQTLFMGQHHTYEEMAAEKICFAHMLRPDDDDLHKMCESYMKRLDSDTKCNLIANCKDRFGTESFVAPGSENSITEWTGDIEVLKYWSGNELLEFLPLAQKLEVEDNFLVDERAERRKREGERSTIYSGVLIPGWTNGLTECS